MTKIKIATRSTVAIGCVYIIICLAALASVAPAQDTQPAQEPSPTQTKTPGQKISLPQALVLGLVEGLTEYLPVSSTGHLILASHYMDLSEQSASSGPLGPKIIKNPAIDSFEVIIQIGAILAVLGLYRKQVGLMIDGVTHRNPAGLRLLGLLAVAFAPAAIMGLTLHKPISEYLFSPYAVAGALVVGGVVMIVVEFFVWRPRRGQASVSKLEHIRYWQALVIGLAQCLAMWPGTSRSMVTILAGLIIGLNIVTAAEFSFLLALPTLGGASAYALMGNWSALMESAGWGALAVGIVVSAVAAAVAVKAFVKWLTRHGMVPFGVYRIALGLAVFAYFARLIKI